MNKFGEEKYTMIAMKALKRGDTKKAEKCLQKAETLQYRQYYEEMRCKQYKKIADLGNKCIPKFKEDELITFYEEDPEVPGQLKKTTKSEMLQDKFIDLGFLVAITRQDSDGFLTEDEGEYIRNKLSDEIDIALNSNSAIPKIYKIIFNKNYIELTCADIQTINWLKSIFHTKTFLPDAQLKVIEAINLDHKTTIYVRVPGIVADYQKFLERLQGQNEELMTEKWILYFAEQKREKAADFTIGIDAISLSILERLQFKPFYGLSTVEFSFIK